jgi:thioesterase domain-containing protein/aryl carrier-like protein
VVATSTVIKAGSHGAPSIGFPIDGARVYLLDEQGEQVPDGCVGEIYIGGAGVGRGYRNLPDLTRRSFLPDPFAGVPGARMYRSGDRGVRRPDGELEFRGRLDRQTKIRGQRVELDEISSILTQHLSIDFAVAIANTSEAGEKRLVAYLLLSESAGVPTANELQEHLLRTLPEYMIPAIFVRLHALPLSANEKLDLSMLPLPTEANMLQRTSPKMPASPIEEEALSMVRRLLERDAIGVDENFFLVGGHSLLGMQLVIQLRRTFGVDLTLQQLFESPTVESLALLVENLLEAERLGTIWRDLLGHDEIGLDENFFDLGGNAELAATLQQRVAEVFGQRIPIAELYRAPTVRQQTALTQRRARTEPKLPSGVLSLKPGGRGNSIFWVHYLSVNLARVIGGDQAFVFVMLTAEDIALLGKAPTLQSIAGCLVAKILATQPQGAYTIGGLCLGGILAYEISSQMQAAGHEVSLLVLLDPPDPTFLQSHDSWTPKLIHPRYLLRRVTLLGPRKTLLKLRERLLKRFPRSVRARSVRTEMQVVQEMIEAAAFTYRPERYEGRVLLLLASDRPPHVNFLPGWQAIVRRNLHAKYIDAHHSELTNAQNARTIADIILSQLTPGAEKVSLPRGTDTSESAGSIHAAV